MRSTKRSPTTGINVCIQGRGHDRCEYVSVHSPGGVASINCTGCTASKPASWLGTTVQPWTHHNDHSPTVIRAPNRLVRDSYRLLWCGDRQATSKYQRLAVTRWVRSE